MQPSKSGEAMPASGLYGTRIPSPRQRQVIELVAQGLKNSEVAEVIGTTEHVVKNHLRIIFDKLGFWNRVELALWYEARRHESLAYSQRDRAIAATRRSTGTAA
ncbi:MAG TPA: LuxR C-terminal-related transcriptional regulator [Terriglobales bacterium]|nr:LuxR C-terminal-related transcriptional regulator [Terriglobales bacterium]